jgi:RNA polymerase sigma factor (TIGR02999 family)
MTDLTDTPPSPALAAVPELLARCDDPAATKELFATLYSELHRLAESHVRKHQGGLTLGATTLVHEVYLRVGERSNLAFPDRARFFAYASRAMRALAIDFARSRRAQKRGRHLAITLDEENVAYDGAAERSLGSLSEALQAMGELDLKLTELVDLHFFGGLSFGEIAALRAVSERTVQRDWQKARMLLKHILRTHAANEATVEPELPF